jgi:hypothetical protein
MSESNYQNLWDELDNPPTIQELRTGEREEDEDPNILRRAAEIGLQAFDWGLRDIEMLKELAFDPAVNYASKALHYLDLLRSGMAGGMTEWGKSVGAATEYDADGRKKFRWVEEGLVPGYPRLRELPWTAFGRGWGMGITGILDEDDPRGRVIRGQDWIKDEFVEEHPIQSGIYGVGIEVFLQDPLTYLPTTVVTTPFRFVRGLFRSLGSTRVGEALLVNSFARDLNIYAGSPEKIKKIARSLMNEINGEDYFLSIAARKNSKNLEKIAKDLGITPNDLHLEILRIMEGYLPGTSRAAGRVGENATEWAKHYQDAWAKFLREEQEAGVSISDIAKRFGDLSDDVTGDVTGYVPHILTELAKSDRRLKGIHRWFNLKKRQGGFAAERTGKGTIEGINIAKAAKGVNPWLHTNPELINLQRAMWHNRSTASARLRNSLKDLGSSSGYPDNFQRLEYEYFTPQGAKKKAYLKNDAGEELYYSPDDVSAFKEMDEILTSAPVANKYLRGFDSAQNWWKTYALITRPAYYTRNIVGNFWNAYAIGGLKNPLRYKEAAILQAKAYWARSGQGKWGGGTVAGIPEEEVFTALVNRGVYNKGQYGLHGDIDQKLVADIGDAATKGSLWRRIGAAFVPSTDNVVAQKVFRAFGATPENNARMALFIDQLHKLKASKLTGKARQDAYDQAAEMVNKALFDYSDVSMFEKNVLKRVLPFYRWSRGNIPAQIVALMQHPDRYQKLNIAIENVQYGVDKPNPHDIADWMRGRYPLYLSANAKEDIYHVIPLLNWHPYADLSQITHPKEFVTQMASPFLKLPMEYFANYDAFRKRDLKQYEGQTADFMGVDMPIHVHRFLTNIVMLAELDRANPYEVFGAQITDPDTGEVIVKKLAYEPFFQKLVDLGVMEQNSRKVNHPTYAELKSYSEASYPSAEERAIVKQLQARIGVADDDIDGHLTGDQLALLASEGARETRRDFPAKIETPGGEVDVEATIADSRAKRLVQFLTGVRVYETKTEPQVVHRQMDFEKGLTEAAYWMSFAEDAKQHRKFRELTVFIKNYVADFEKLQESLEQKRMQ